MADRRERSAASVAISHHRTADEALLDAAIRNGRPPDADLRGIVAGLPERQRLTLFLRYYADLDYASIGQVLEIAPGTVGATLNAARASLRRRLEEVSR